MKILRWTYANLAHDRLHGYFVAFFYACRLVEVGSRIFLLFPIMASYLPDGAEDSLETRLSEHFFKIYVSHFIFLVFSEEAHGNQNLLYKLFKDNNDIQHSVCFNMFVEWTLNIYIFLIFHHLVVVCTW